MTYAELGALLAERGVPADAEIERIDLDYPARGHEQEITVSFGTANAGLQSEHTVFSVSN